MIYLSASQEIARTRPVSACSTHLAVKVRSPPGADSVSAFLLSCTHLSPLTATRIYAPQDTVSPQQDADNGKRLEEEAKEQAATWLSDLTKRCGIDTKTLKVIVGRPAVEIRRLAEELDADLIVTGTHGRHGMGLMLGSTANAVLHGTQCSVLAVRVRAEESE